MIGDTDLNVALGQPLDRVRSIRPNLSYQPYAGWVEDLDGSRYFSIAIYHFGTGQPGENPTRGRLEALRLIARETVMTNDLTGQFDTAYGQHVFAGCTQTPEMAGAVKEISVLRWARGSMSIFLEALYTRTRDSIASNSPPVLSFVREPGGTARIGIVDLRKDCFSEGFAR